MNEAPMIYKAMSAAMAEIGAVTKDKRNAQQGFMYRGIDDVMNALHPVLSKHGLFLAPEVLEHRREERQTKNGSNLIYSVMKIRYTMYAGDGSNVSATVIGEGMDSADKSSNKAMAIAMKYAMFQLFCIPTEEMANADPDGHSPPDSTPVNQTPPAPPSAPPVKMKKETPAAVVLNRICSRYQVDAYGFAYMRAVLVNDGVIEDKPSAEMTEQDWLALERAIDQKFGDGQ